MDSPSQPARKVPLRRRWHVPGGHMLLSLSLAALVAAAPQGGFVGHLPEGVPGLERWNKASGSAQLENGASIDYELYYDSGRADYELIRYRISGWDGGGGPPYSSNEKMQWQVHV
ncbi:MAG TPA: hypothetical protein VFO85_09160, partial [Vicinamibacteria bacterium]|nr:hypothetical protein [Vicinamibacteria bacterium]